MQFTDPIGNTYQVKYAKANHTASTTDGALVAAVTDRRITVLAMRLHAGATAVQATFNTRAGTAAGTACSEAFSLGANGGRADGFSPVGHFRTNKGEALTLTVGTGSTVGVGVAYIEELE